MSSQNIGFYEEMAKIIFKLSSYTHLIYSFEETYSKELLHDKINNLGFACCEDSNQPGALTPSVQSLQCTNIPLATKKTTTKNTAA